MKLDEILTVYIGKLTTTSPLFNRLKTSSAGQFYYDEIEILISKSGLYKFTSDSTFDIYAYFYHSYFNSTNPTSNLLISDDDDGYQYEFDFNYYLEANAQKYILVITSYPNYTTGLFSIHVRGPSTVTFR